MSKKKKNKKDIKGDYKVGYGKLPPGSGWKKGQSGNPLGGKAHNPELKRIKNLTNNELVEVANLIIKGSINDLKEMKDDDEQTVLKRMLASVAVKIISKGDMHALDVLLNRLVGKVKDKLDVEGFSLAPGAQVIISLPSNGRERDQSASA